MDTEKKIKKLEKDLLVTNVMLLILSVLTMALCIKDINARSKLTEAVSNVSQKAGVEFNVKTNNVFGAWQVIKPVK